MRWKSTLSAIAIAASGQAGAASLEGMLPRGKDVCYGGPAQGTNPVFGLVRVTRPERFQAYDSQVSRMTRIVVNLAAPKARLEDTATCREKDGEIVCASNSCEGAVFVLREERDGRLRLKFDLDIPRALWSCAEEPLRSIRMRDDDRYITLQRGSGSCIPAHWSEGD